MPETITRTGVRKVTLNLPESTLAKLRELAQGLELNLTQVIREAIEVRHVLHGEVRKGHKIVIRRTDGSETELLLRGS